MLRAGDRFVFLSQGSTDVDEPETALAPFLFSRAGLAALLAKKKVHLQIALATDEIELQGKKEIEIAVHGKKKKVKALHARGKEIDLVVLDDADWPLVLRAEWEDENYIELKSIG